MSKSKGNVINPIELVTKYGSDAFRLGILRGRSAGMNQAFSEQSVVAGRNLCNKLWNISRFIQEIVDDANNGRADSSTSVLGSSDKPGIVSPEAHDSSFAGDNQSLKNGSVELSALTVNPGEDWICREINQAKWQVESQMKNYRFSEAVETLYSLVWDKFADWFIENEKIYRNVELLKVTLEAVLKMLHPFAPFVTEAVWQNLSWTEGLLISQKWPLDFTFDPISAESYEKLMEVVISTRSTLQSLQEAHKGFSKSAVTMLYGDDSLVDDNSLLVQKLTGVSTVISCADQPRGLRLPVANHEVYLDVTPDVVADYAQALENRILAVGRELDSLNMMMMNPNYVDKAPAELVNETRKLIAEKEELIERLKREREAI